MVPEGGYENTFVMVARFDGIWRPTHVFDKNELIEIFRTLSAHWFDLVSTFGETLEEFRSILIILRAM